MLNVIMLSVVVLNVVVPNGRVSSSATRLGKVLLFGLLFEGPIIFALEIVTPKLATVWATF